MELSMKGTKGREDSTLDVWKLCHAGIPVCADIKRGRIWAKERARKGYCWYDLADIDQWFLIVIVKMLREFSKKHQGYPQEFLEQEYHENREQYLLLDINDLYGFGQDKAENEMKQLLGERADARWTETITEMADRFESLRVLSENNDPRLEKETAAAFALFVKWFHHLWI